MEPFPAEIYSEILSWLVDDKRSLIAWAMTSKANACLASLVLYRNIQCEALATLVHSQQKCIPFVKAVHFQPALRGQDEVAMAAMDKADIFWKALHVSQNFREFHWTAGDHLSRVFPAGVPEVLQNISVLKVSFVWYSNEDVRCLVSLFNVLHEIVN
jgi:hypothetical protein